MMRFFIGFCIATLFLTCSQLVLRVLEERPPQPCVVL
jgi:hypothetical protein